MPGTLFLIDPASRLSFEHDWSRFLAADESIVERQWSISPTHGDSPETPTLSNANAAVVFVEGCRNGNVYKLVERCTTSANVVQEQTIVLRCSDT